MPKPVFQCAHALVVLSLLGLVGCYSTVEVSDSSAEKAIAIDWVEPPCAEPGSAAGYIEGNGFGAKNVTITVGGIEAQVLAATGKDASFVVPEGLPPGPIEVMVMNPGGRLATIQWVVCGFDCSAIDCDDGNECTADTCDPAVEMCVHTPVGDGVACDFDGLPGLCIADVCEEDLCASVDCDDGNECTTDSCDPTNGACIHVNTCGDLDPPVLTDFDFDPKQIDVSAQGQSVTCSFAVTDSGVGVGQVQCFFVSPSGKDAQCFAFGPSSGNVFDGVWDCTVTIPASSEPGTWVVSAVVPYDMLNNSEAYNTADLQTLGFPTQLDVTSGSPDTDPPVLTDFDFDPKQIDVSAQGQSVTCSFAVTDSGVGVGQVQCFFVSPSGKDAQCFAFGPSSGNVFDGVWDCTVTIPASSEPGTWVVSAVVPYDMLNNSEAYNTADLQTLGFPTQLDVTSGSPDTDPPVLTDFDFDPKQIDVSAQGQSVTCSFAVTDSGVGVGQVQCFFVSPSGKDAQCFAFGPSSGNVFDGVWDCTVTIPASSEPGTWVVSAVVPYDMLNNSEAYNTADLQTLGFPTQLDVTYGGGSPP